MSKKKKGKKKLVKQLTKQLKKVIKIHGQDLALGFVTGIISKLIADKTGEPKKSKVRNKQEAESALTTAVKKTTKAVTNKVKAVLAPKTPVTRKAPATRKQPVKKQPISPSATSQ